MTTQSVASSTGHAPDGGPTAATRPPSSRTDAPGSVRVPVHTAAAPRTSSTGAGWHRRAAPRAAETERSRCRNTHPTGPGDDGAVIVGPGEPA